MMRGFVVFLLSAITVVSSYQGAAAQTGETVIKFGHFVPSRSYTARTGYIPWLRRIEAASQGRIKFQEFWGGALSRSPSKQYELLVNGIQDGTIVVPSYTLQLFPEFDLFGLPYIVDTAEEASVVGWRLHKRGLLSGLDKMHVTAVYTNGNAALHFTRKFTSLDQFKGLKIRVSGPGEVAIVKTFGAAPVSVSIVQTAESLSRGVVDGAYSSWSALRSFRILPVLKTHYWEPLGVLGFVVGFNKAVFDRLPERDRKAIDSQSGEALSRFLGSIGDKEVHEVSTVAKKNPASVHIVPSASERAKRAAMFRRTLHESWVGKHKNGRTVYNAFNSILADVRAGR